MTTTVAAPTSAPAQESRPLGASRLADRLAARVGVEVVYEDVRTLAEADLVPVVDEYKGWPLYDVEAADALPADHVRAVVEARLAWFAESVPVEAAATILDVPAIAIVNAAAAVEAKSGVGLGWTHKRVPAWLAETITGAAEAPTPEAAETAAGVRAALEIAPARAAAWLGLRRTDFDHLVRADLLAPASETEVQTGRRSYTPVPLFRVEHLDRALEDPRVPWPQLREVTAGERSPLLALLKAKVPNRPAALRAWTKSAEAAFGVGFLARWDRWEQAWCLAWDTYAPPAPSHVGDEPVTVERVEAFLAADERADEAGLTPESVRLGDGQLGRVWWARHMLTPGTAVVLDTETTGLYDPDVIEVAVIDAATGKTRFHSRVRPTVEIEHEARAVHGIADHELEDAPSWAQVLPKLRRAIGTRQVLAWNAEFDRHAIAATTRRAEPVVRHTGHLARRRTWECLMDAAMTYTASWYRIALNGPHDAIGDCHAARDWLLKIAEQ